MADSRASDGNALTVDSHRGPYSVHFIDDPFSPMAEADGYFIVDERVRDLYRAEIDPALEGKPVLELKAAETSKSLHSLAPIIEDLLSLGIKRGATVVAVGGGIMQDIAAFIATVLFRGVNWEFYPTTLLAQADSCIGSKSSINVGPVKNAVGTFLPPQRVMLAVRFLETLERDEVHSGIGEMLKVHAIRGPEAFDALSASLDELLTEPSTIGRFIRQSLEYKRALVEIDEFDQRERQVMNYGHSFGHAIESATNFGVPHGIAVTIGMDMANYVASRLGRMSHDHYDRMTPAMRWNAGRYYTVDVPFDPFLQALSKDKKNVARDLTLILPDETAVPRTVRVPNDSAFRELCEAFFAARAA